MEPINLTRVGDNALNIEHKCPLSATSDITITAHFTGYHVKCENCGAWFMASGSENINGQTLFFSPAPKNDSPSLLP